MLHIPVLLQEAITGLSIYKEGIYIDATFGRGGHSQAILNELGSKGRLIALDRDPSAVKYGQVLINDTRFTIMHRAFSQLEKIAEEQKVVNKVDGILLDLGVSSTQLDEAERGFSFLQEGILDMRMDPTQGESLIEWLATVDQETLSQVLFEYGEERYGRRIAKAIIEARNKTLLVSTKQLADIIATANPKWELNKHPATRSFQALRIVINKELEELEKVLITSIKVLKKGGILAVISFHSLEDRLVKKFIHQHSTVPAFLQKLPFTQEQLMEKSSISLRSISKAMKPSAVEVASNPRSRSAVLRIAEKIV